MARFKYQRKPGEFAKAFASIRDPIAEAGSGAIIEAASLLKSSVRTDMARAGFSRKFQNAWRVDVFPKPPRTSINAAAFGFSKVPYAGVFEDPTVISGKPKLWLPLASTPKRLGGKRMTPALYVRTIGPLFSIERPGLPPLLAGQIATNRRGQKAGTKGKITLSALRRAGAGQPSRLVPLFVGIDRVAIPDKLHVREDAEGIAARLGELYLKHLRV